MFRYATTLSIALGIIGCGKIIPPLAMDLATKVEKKSFSYAPDDDRKSFLVKTATGQRGATQLRGTSLVQSNDYGPDNALMQYADWIFSNYSTVVSAVYSTTIKVSAFDRYFTNFFYPNQGSNQFSFWGDNNQSRNWGVYDLVLTMAANVMQYRIDIDYPQDANYDGYTLQGSPYGRQETVIWAWNKLADGKSLEAKLRVVPGSIIRLTTAIGKTKATVEAESPTLNLTAVVTPVSGFRSTSTTPVTVTRNLSSLVAKSTSAYPYGYGGRVNTENVQADQLTVVVRGMNNDRPADVNFCWWCPTR